MRVAAKGYNLRLSRLGLALFLALAACLGPRPPARAGAPLPTGWTVISTGLQPPARTQYGMAADAAGNLYVYGGRDAQGSPLGDFWVYRPAHAGWQHLPSIGSLPPLVEPHLAVDAAGDVFEFGGIGLPGGPHFTADGHSFGLYEYLPAQGAWTDLTPRDSPAASSWPGGREDHGLAYDPTGNALYLFAGEGQGNVSLNDMWRYDLAAKAWQRVTQHYSAPGGASIDPREIYSISYDNHGGFYLFGGAYLTGPDGKDIASKYVNDLWRFDIAGQTWRLVAGRANAYDPTMPLPRHYYGQACDASGNFYILGGYLSDIVSPPFFSDSRTILDTQVVAFALFGGATGDISYATDDFWRFDPLAGHWIDQSAAIGVLAGNPFIPYVMVANLAAGQLLTFGGFHDNQDRVLAASADLWTYTLPTPPFPDSTSTPGTPGPGTATISATVSLSGTVALTGTAVLTSTSTLTATRTPTATPGHPAKSGGGAARHATPTRTPTRVR